MLHQTLSAFLCIVASVNQTQLQGPAGLDTAKSQLDREIVSDQVAVSAKPTASSPNDLKAYLKHAFPGRLKEINVGDAKVFVTGEVPPGTKDVYLASFPMSAPSTDVPMSGRKEAKTRTSSLTLQPIEIDAKGFFKIHLARRIESNGRSIDQFSSRWQLFRRLPGHDYKAFSHGRYADHIVCRDPTRPEKFPRTKKGLGGWSASREPKLGGELDTLGIDSVTVNVAGIHRFVSTSPRAGHRPFEWQGRTFYANERELERMDKTFRAAAKRNAVVSAILLIACPRNQSSSDASLLAHDDADSEAMYAMPDVASFEGLVYYGAILNLLAERWSREDGRHGCVHHWIVHNEIDFGWTWTNAGRKSDVEYMELYHRSMRLVHLISRQYDPNARALISLTHHWADKGGPNGYGSKRMLELLVQFCDAEGDFPWAVAFHPYPQSLFKPRTWEDSQASFDFNTKKITPKNLEVLDAFMKTPTMRFKGEVRPVQLSENGFNSKDYSDVSLNEQAAAMAWSWKKIKHLSSIQCWEYHNWVDNRREGGLKIGLRKYRDDEAEPLGPKPIWHLYRALATADEDAFADPYLKVIGLTSWEEVLSPKEVLGTPGTTAEN